MRRVRPGGRPGYFGAQSVFESRDDFLFAARIIGARLDQVSLVHELLGALEARNSSNGVALTRPATLLVATGALTSGSARLRLLLLLELVLLLWRDLTEIWRVSVTVFLLEHRRRRSF